MNTILVILTMVAGVIQPHTMEIQARSRDCMEEIIVVHALNRANQAAGRDIQYLVQCENR